MCASAGIESLAGSGMESASPESADSAVWPWRSTATISVSSAAISSQVSPDSPFSTTLSTAYWTKDSPPSDLKKISTAAVSPAVGTEPTSAVQTFVAPSGSFAAP